MLRGVAAQIASLGPAVVPAGLLLLFAAGCGTFAGAASAAGALVAHLALVAVALVAGGAWRDPLRLGRTGQILLVALALVAVLSWYQSPLPRAGRTALVLAPVAFLIPGLVELCWSSPARRRVGLWGMSMLVAGVSGWALYGWLVLETPGASLPLGHHNLLAAFLLTLLPVAVLPWRDGGAGRLLAGGAGILAVAALLATKSFAALAALALLLILAAWRWRPWIAVALAAGPLLVMLPRLRAILTGLDTSASVRFTYLEAAWRGILERPWLGWGPGTSPWLLANFLEPRPGLHPPDQVVADPHSLPWRLAFEMGIAAPVLALVIAVLFWRRRHGETADDSALRHAALLGGLAFTVLSLGGRPFAAPAIPLALAVVAGIALAAGPERPDRHRIARPSLLAPILILLLLPLDRAHLHYDRALVEEDFWLRFHHLDRAVRLDPRMPIYRFERALIERRDPVAATMIRQAAEDAVAVAPYWHAAGRLGLKNGFPWFEEAMIRACKLGPLSALPPFRLAHAAADGDPRAPVWAARALLVEPRLAAAVEWRGRRDLLLAASREVRRVEGVLPAALDQLAEILDGLPEAHGATRRMVLAVDDDGSTSLSLHVFRRRPWPVLLDEVAIDVELLPFVELPPVASRDDTAPEVFLEPGCGLPRS